MTSAVVDSNLMTLAWLLLGVGVMAGACGLPYWIGARWRAFKRWRHHRAMQLRRERWPRVDYRVGNDAKNSPDIH